MSARLLRKVLKEQSAAQQQQLRRQLAGPPVTEKKEEQQLNNGDESEESPDSSAHSSRNPFDLLNDHDHDDDLGFESEIAGESSVGNIDDKEPSMVKATLNTVPSSNNHKAKKKKKKKTKEDPFSTSENVEKPMNVMLQNLSLDVNSSCQPGPIKAAKPANVKVGDSLVKQCTLSILQVDPKFLSAENELRRIFGSKVVNSFEKSHQTGSSRHIRGVRRGSHNHRKTILISPSSHWPRWDGSLSMELLETRDGYHYFRYVHSSSYGQAQSAFEAAKAIHDLNGIASILLYHPYHIDSLITLAEYFKFSGEHQMSTDATAKCLYALECAWHPMFSPLQANCQLKYGHDTNKPLFSTLFTHMKNMDRRGCHRSALEICKLLLSLDSDDPMGAMFCIDYYSLRAEEYTWLERFAEEYRSDNSLWLFPNFSYSLAICRFYLEHEVCSKETDTEIGKATSTDLVKQALMLHPSVLKKLVAKVPFTDQVWTNILKHSFFVSDQTGIPSLDHLINIYVERSYIVWRLPDLQKLLKDCALLVIETLEHNRTDAKDWACVRKEAFSFEKNEYCHLLVSDFSDLVPTMPPDNLQNFLVDPRMREVQNGDHIANRPGREHAPRDVANRNALAVLFESMLPWIDYGGRGDGGDGEDDLRDGHEQDDED
uniref:Transcription factor 25 n=1 Tax=Davidia involucrata TaxID=16924 RepID=A0A5B7CBL4_DAVIN